MRTSGFGRRTLLKSGAALGIALGFGGFTGTALGQVVDPEEGFPPDPACWHEMEFNTGTNLYDLAWTPPATAEPEGLLGSIHFRVLDTAGTELAVHTTGLGLDPAAREIGFQLGDEPRERVRGGLVIEGDQLGVAFIGDSLIDGRTYSLTVTDPDGVNVLEPLIGEPSLSFVAAGGRGGTELGPVTTTTHAENLSVADPVNLEDTFTYTVSNGLVTQDSGPADLVEEPPEPHDDFPLGATTEYRVWVVEPAVEEINGEPEIEVIASSLAGGAATYPFEVFVTPPNSTTPTTDVRVQWQAILAIDGQAVCQEPGEVIPGGPGQSVITLIGDPSRARTWYELTTSGPIEKNTENGASINANDVITDNGDGTFTASGTLLDGRDGYAYLGSIVDIKLFGGLVEEVGGQRVSTVLTAERKMAGETAFSPFNLAPFVPSVLSVVGLGPRSFYDMGIDSVMKSTEDLGSVQGNDVIGLGTVSGTVVGGVDSYAVQGDPKLLGQAMIDDVLSHVSFFTSTGVYGTDYVIRVNGVALSADDVAALAPTVITVQGAPTRGFYSFNVVPEEGSDRLPSVTKSLDCDASINGNDFVDDLGDGTFRVAGTVIGGRDSYVVSNGQIVNFTVDAGEIGGVELNCEPATIVDGSPEPAAAAPASLLEPTL